MKLINIIKWITILSFSVLIWPTLIAWKIGRKLWTTEIPKKRKYIAIFFVALVGLFFQTTWSIAFSRSNEKRNSVEVSSLTPTPTAIIKKKYEKIEYKSSKLVDNLYYLYTGGDTSKVEVETVVKEIKTNDCKKSCNISLYDNKEALYLDLESMEISDIDKENEWRKKNYIFVADHLIGYLEFSTDSYISYYPYRDSLYNEIKGSSISSNPKPTMTPTIIQNEYKVVRVIDGDTIEIEGGKKVRYIGIDTPETVNPNTIIECFGKESSIKNTELVEGKVVRLEKDVSETDKYGRLLRYVYVGDVFVNDYLVRQGYANSYTYPPDVKYQSQFKEAETEAKNSNLGLWKSCPLGDSTTPKAIVSTVKTNVNATGCTIKGNISSKGEKIYHMIGQSYYDKTVIDINAGEKWFCSEKEAVSAGWRKSLR